MHTRHNQDRSLHRKPTNLSSRHTERRLWLRRSSYILLLALVVVGLYIGARASTAGISLAAPNAPSAGDHALYVRASGTYPDDAVILPVTEALEARYMAADREFTVEYWFKLPAGYDSHGKELFDHHVPSQEGFWTAFQNGHLWAGIDTEPGNDNTAIHIQTGSGFNDGEWHHYALVRDLNASPEQLCLYLDGVGSCYEEGTNPEWASVAADIRSALNQDGDDDNNKPAYVIGARTNGGNEIEAAIDELRVSDVARYRGDFTPSPTPFALDANTVMLFHFNEGTGNTTTGRDGSHNSITGTLVKSFTNYGVDMTPLNPQDPTDAAWLEEMWVEGRFGVSASTLTLLTPNGGETWTAGTEHPIRWVSEGEIGPVELSYSTTGSTIYLPITTTTNTGVYTWTVPNDPTDSAQVRVSSALTATISDTSDAFFTITPPPPPPLTLGSPNGGETWQVDSQRPITWSSNSSITHVNLRYSTDGFKALSHTIALSLSNTGLYTWTTPLTPTNAVRVRVANTDDPAIYDDSDGDFEIVAPTAPTLTLILPNGGEQWYVNNSYPIRWASAETITQVSLSYSTDNFVGVSYTIESSLSNTGLYTWTTPLTPANAVRVRVANVKDPTTYDDSDDNLTIAGTAMPPAGDFAIHLHDSGTYPDDAVILPVTETLEARYAAPNREFTVEYWFKLPTGYDSHGKELFDHHVPSNEGFWTAFQNGQLWAGIDTEPGNDSTAIHLQTGYSSTFNDGQWHHYALVRDLNASPNRLCLYLDGAGSCYEDGSNAQWARVYEETRSTNNRDGDDSNNYPLYVIGARTSGGGEIEAIIDELRISDVARYRGDFTPRTTPFTIDSDTVMLFHFDEGVGNATTGHDSDNTPIEGLLTQDAGWYGIGATQFDPNDPWLDQMWTQGRFDSPAPPPDPTLTVEWPNTLQLWKTDKEYPIQWNWTGTITHVDLSYSTDGFATSRIIELGALNSGIYTWTTPITPSNSVYVRVSAADNPAIYDDTDEKIVLTETIQSIFLPVIIKND